MIADGCTHRLVKLLCSIVVTVTCDHRTETLPRTMDTITEFTSQGKYLKCCSSMTNSRAHKSVQTTDIVEKFAWTVFLPLSCILDVTSDFDLFCPVKDGLWGNAGDQTLQDTRFLQQHRKENGYCHVGVHALIWRGRGVLTETETTLTK